MKEKNIEILTLAIAFFIVLFSNIIFSNPGPFEDLKCSDVWGSLCNLTTTNDAFPPCNGTQIGDKDWSYVSEVYINATNFFPESGINVTCKFREIAGVNNYEYLWYYNTTDWINIQNWTVDNDEIVNKSTIFKINSSEGMHIVRCVISFQNATSSDCANSSTTSAGYYDNDDVNFTVTGHLTYNFWNLTNYTTGADISSGGTYNRSNSGNVTYINVSAHWSKVLYNAWIEHNGTGTPRNYTISSPYTGNWTNYTINLSDATKYNQYNITINTIYVNDTFSVTNNTSPLLFFYLDIGLEPPNISSYWFQPLTNRTNLYTNLTIYANVSDDSGISTVRANLTYPDNTSVILNLTGDPNPGNQTWNYTFRTTGFTLNETGNYTVSWVSVKDNWNQEVNLTQNLTFYVTNNLTVNVSVPSSTPGKGTPINPVSISIFDVSNNYHQFLVNLTVRCLNISYVDTNFSLANVNGQTTLTDCYAPDSYSTPFNITVNATDSYNNTGQNYTVLTTESQTSSSIPSGSSGGFVNTSTSTKPKNCSDRTLYNQCSTKRPYYCSNGTLTQKCSICGCPNNTYNCQPAGYCVLTKEEDFNFTLDITKIELMQGQDFDGKIGSLVNNGKNLLNLIAFINTSEDCCNISMSTNYILNEKEEKEVEMSMHVPLFISDKIYLIKIGIGTPILKKERTIELTVKKSLYQNIIIDYINEITNLENRIQTYKGSGVDTRNLEALVQQSKDSLKNANDSLSSDQADTLVNSLAELKNSIESSRPVLSNMLLQGFLFRNSWLIALLVIFSLTTMYMVPQVLLPLNKKEKELTELKEEEKNLVATRIETEKQYFMRKIDENTFTKIMIGKQDKVLRTRAAIKEKETERTRIIKSMSPISMFRWFGNSIKNVPKRILNRNNKTISEVNGKNQ